MGYKIVHIWPKNMDVGGSFDDISVEYEGGSHYQLKIESKKTKFKKTLVKNTPIWYKGLEYTKYWKLDSEFHDEPFWCFESVVEEEGGSEKRHVVAFSKKDIQRYVHSKEI